MKLVQQLVLRSEVEYDDRPQLATLRLNAFKQQMYHMYI